MSDLVPLPASSLPAVSGSAPSSLDWWTPTNLADAKEIAKHIAASGIVPKDYIGKPEKVLTALIFGSPLGLRPLACLTGTAVINGKPSLFGDALAAVVKGAGGQIEEHLEGDGKELRAVCIVKRPGHRDVTSTFSVADADKAGLWKKVGPWTTYPRRMLQMRARAFACRDQYPDALAGMAIVEEQQDVERNVTEEVTVSDAPDAPKKGTAGLAEKIRKKKSAPSMETRPVVYPRPGTYDGEAADHVIVVDVDPGSDGDARVFIVDDGEAVDASAAEIEYARGRIEATVREWIEDAGIPGGKVLAWCNAETSVDIALADLVGCYWALVDGELEK